MFAQREGRGKVNSFERSQFGRLDRGSRVNHFLIEFHHGHPRRDGPGSPNRAASDASGHPLHLDPGDHARHSVRPRPEEIAQGIRLGLGHNELHDGRGIEIQELPRHGLRAIFPKLPKGVGPLGGGRALRRGEVEEVSFRRRGSSRGHQFPEG